MSDLGFPQDYIFTIIPFTLLLCLNVLLFPPQTDADPEVCKRMCKADDYENVHSLVSYYQMVRQEKAQRFSNALVANARGEI